MRKMLSFKFELQHFLGSCIHFLLWCFKVMSFSWARIEFIGDPIAVMLGYLGDARLFR